ncbi:MAG TPA: immunoglobulin domain-containing protein, partial [Candidatus Dormibacteraeota bacterium]|nr:immunoglobulin domain-containing protein [Candidatus Dormibacteraeota bacterium]
IACSWTTEEHLILSNSGLMNLARLGAPNTDTVALGASHFLNQGVSAPFTSSYIAWYSSANGTTVMQSSSNGNGVVLARDIGLGHVVMIGTDYNILGTQMDRIVANAVRWAQGTQAISTPITPTISGNFSNGVWTGTIAVQAFATNLVLRADDGDGHFGLSNPFHVITSNQPPIIIASPVAASAYLGATAAFQGNVLASAPLSYQWRFNGADIPGATNSTLNLNRVTLGQAGNYSVVAWNPWGTNSSAKASLSVVQVVAWGAGTNNTGINFNYGQAIVPSGMTNAVQLSGGLYHSIAVRADGKVSAWGAGTTNTGFNPHYGQSAVPPVASVSAGAAGGYHSLALRGDGTLAAWGAGTNNLLSLPYYGQSIVPFNTSNIIAIAAGDYHSVALRNDGKVFAWGYNSFQQTNVPTAATSNVVAIASRASHVLALKSDGSMVHWGSLSTLPIGISNIVTIAAGVNHCLALRSDGTVVSFGSQTTVPTGLSNVVDIAAGADHNLALRSDGTVVTWGATNLYGRNLIPAGLSNFVGIACGYYHSMALLGDGSPVIKWQPANRSTLLGSPASFYVLGAGPQLGYQWRFNGTNLPGATNFTYAIQSAQALNAGNYQVVLANPFGAATSAVANLTVLAPIGAAVDAPNLSWSTSGNAAWFGQTGISHDGIDAAQSGLITDSQQSSVQASVSGPGVLNFWWKVSSEQYFDFLNFFIDATQQTNISGEVDWQSQTFAVGSGVHILRWTYQKDSSVSAGLDAGWLDQVLYTTNPPIITVQPIGQTNFMGATFNLNVSASGAPPISYQWLKAGTNIGGAVSSSFNIITATRHDSAIYSVVASNPGGSNSSSNVVVLIRVPQRLNALMQADRTFALTSSDADGGSLSPEDLGRFECQSSSNLLNWISLTNSVIVTNGTLFLIDRNSTNYPQRFYRIIEH